MENKAWCYSNRRFMYGCKYWESPNCNYCGELDDLTHIFVTCSRLSGLFQLTIDKIPVWELYVISRVNVEYQFIRFQNTVFNFVIKMEYIQCIV